MSYQNTRHAGRILNIARAENLFGKLSTSKTRGSIEVPLAKAEPDQTVYLTPELVGSELERDVFNFPFLLNADGKPWYEANSFLLDQVAKKHVMTRPTDDSQRRATRLLDYKIFTEEKGIDWLDFSGRRLTSRPTYRYFKHLVEQRGMSARVVNQYTSDVYQLYKFISKNWHDIPMERVDSVKTVKVFFETHTGSRSVEQLKRSQTKPTPPTPQVAIGYVRDSGEVLRPLQDTELAELKAIINGPQWSPIERLIMLVPIMTGARKQSVLTIRVKHIDRLVKEGQKQGNFYELYAGPGTQIDTKNQKPQKLKLPSQLVHELHVYAHCPQAKARRKKFQNRYKLENPGLKKIADEDLYLFLSDQGNCYFMAKNDPRYPMLKSPPRGQVVDTLKRKLFKEASENFPRDFYYHWLRATHALLLWKSLEPRIESGVYTQSEAIGIIQNRMHHQNRETTENYLKLFLNMDKKLIDQELFEEFLLPDSIFPEEVSS